MSTSRNYKNAEDLPCSGSIIIDAACSLPIFIMAMVLMLSLISRTGTEAKSFAEMTGKTDLVTGFLATFNKESTLLYPGMEFGLKAELSDGYVINNICRYEKDCSTQVVAAGIFNRSISGEKLLYYRPFLGESMASGCKSGEKVYVFPKYGEKYHNFGCVFLKEASVETVLNSQIKRKYSPCKTCKPEKLPQGAKVYIFLDSNSSYHRKSCASVTKNYICIAKNQAEEEGYTACSYCISASD